MKSIIKFVSFSNIWIGLAACVLAMSNLLSLRWLPNMAEPALSIHGAKYLLIFIGTSCTFMYTAIRLVGLREKHESASSEMLDWVRRYKTFVIIWAAICLIVAMYCFYHLYMVQMLIIMFAGLLCGLYAVPIYKSGMQWKSLREVPYIKTIIVAIVWSMLCVSCVMVQADMYPVIVRPQHILLFTINFFFILGLTIPFDIRDMEYDKEAGVKTISHLIGVEKTKKLSIGILVLYMILSFVFFIYIPCYINYPVFFRSFNQAIFTAAIAGGLAAIFIVKNISSTSKESVFTFELDGVIIAQSIFMIGIYSVYYFFN